MAENIRVEIDKVTKSLQTMTNVLISLRSEASQVVLAKKMKETAAALRNVGKSLDNKNIIDKTVQNVKSGNDKIRKSTITTTNSQRTALAKLYDYWNTRDDRSQKKRIQNLNSYSGRMANFFKQQLAWYPTKALTFGVLAIPGNVIRSTAAYGDALTQVSSVAGLTSAQLKVLDKEVRKVGTTTKFSLIEVAEATKTLVQAGFRGEEVAKALKPIALLATATGASVKAATQLTTTIIRAYGKSVAEFEDISDKLANAVTNSKLTLDELNTSFNYVASASAQTGVSFEETITLLGTLANTGLKATTAATGLRMMLLKLSAPTKKAQKVFDRVGLAPKDLDIARKGIKEVLRELNNLDRTSVIEIFGARSANAVLAFRNTSIEAIDMLQQSIEVSGTVTRMAKEQLMSLQQSWKQLLDVIQDTSVTFGNTFSEDIAINIRTITSLIRENGKVVTHLGGAFGLLKFAIAGLGIKLVSSQLSKLFGVALINVKALNFELLRTSGILNTKVVTGFSKAVLYSKSLLASINPLAAGIVAAVTVAGFLAKHFYDIRRNLEATKTAISQLVIGINKFDSNILKIRSNLINLISKDLPEATRRIAFGSIADTLEKEIDSILKNIQLKTKIPKTIIENLRAELIGDLKTIPSGDLKRIDTWTQNTLGTIQSTVILALERKQEALLEKARQAFAPAESGVTRAMIEENIIVLLSKAEQEQYAQTQEYIDDLKRGGQRQQDVAKLLSDNLSNITKISDLRQEMNKILEKSGTIGLGTFKSLSDEFTSLIGIFSGISKKDPSNIRAAKFLEEVEVMFRQLGLLKITINPEEIASSISSASASLKSGLKDEFKQLIEKAKRGVSLEEVSKQAKKLGDNFVDTVVQSIVDSIEDKAKGEGEAARGKITAAVTKLKDKLIPKETLEEEALDFKIVFKEVSLEVLKSKLDLGGTAAQIDETKTQIIMLTAALEKLKFETDLADKGLAFALKAQIARRNKRFYANAKIITDDIKQQIQASISAIGEITTLISLAKDDDRLSDYQVLAQQVRAQKLVQIKLLRELFAEDTTKTNEKESITRRIQILQEQIDTLVEKSRFSLKDLSKDIQGEMTSSFQTFFDDVIEGTKSVSDAFRDMARSILSSISKSVTDRLAAGLVAGIFGSGGGMSGFLSAFMNVGVAHSGGVIGKSALPTRKVHPSLFANAARYHNGLAGDEFPTILQKGETVLPKGYSLGATAPKVTINMKNTTNQQFLMETVSSGFDGEEFIINTVVKNAANNGIMRQLI